MSTEVVSIGRLQRNISSLLDELLENPDEASLTSETELQEYRDHLAILKSEIEGLNESLGLEDSSTEGLANLVAEVVHAAYNYQIEYSPTDARQVGTPASSDQPADSVSSSGGLTQMGFRPIGWDGQNWRTAASQPNKPANDSVLELKEHGLDVFLDVLQDGVKEALLKPLNDQLTSTILGSLSYILGPKVFASAAATTYVFPIIGIVLLFSIKYFQPNAVTIPDDCACVWSRIQDKGAAEGVITPGRGIEDFRQAAGLYPKPYRLAPCTTRYAHSISSCPFRVNEQDKLYCLLAYDDISLSLDESPTETNHQDQKDHKESRDEKVSRTFEKLVSLGLLETRIDCEPNEYHLA